MVFTTPMNGLGEERGWKEVFFELQIRQELPSSAKIGGCSGLCCLLAWLTHRSSGLMPQMHRSKDSRT